MNNLRALGFDLDKTLYKPNDEIDKKIQDYACEQASKYLGSPYISVREKFAEQLQALNSGRRAIMSLGVPEEEARGMIQEGLENADISSTLERDERLASLIEKASRRYKTFLITGSRESLSDKKLEALGINKNLFYPQLYSGVEHKRENGAAFRYVSDILGIPLEEMMFVGDRESVDIIPANALGMKTAIVNAQSAHATYQLNEIYDLEKILFEINLSSQS
ncbi:HAD family hydrolase [Candidatus Pacearchaeota archaeon]|nr:HAD family hydrolase [Candidatus Pacearchaeota archaeon]